MKCCDVMKNTETRIVNKFAPAIIMPKVTSWAAPAKTMADIATLCQKVKPACFAIDPANIPHGITETHSGSISIAPRINDELEDDCSEGEEQVPDSIIAFLTD